MSWIEKTDEYFRSLRLWDLKLDEAYVNFTLPSIFKEIFLYGLSAECDRCPFTKLGKITTNESVVTVDTSERLEFKVFAQNKGKYVFDNSTDFLCHEKPNLGEFGVYDVEIEQGCQFQPALDPVNPILCKYLLKKKSQMYKTFNFSIFNSIDCCHVNNYRFRIIV